MKKIFISQPMYNINTDELLKVRNEAIDILNERFKEPIWIIDTLDHGIPNNIDFAIHNFILNIKQFKDKDIYDILDVYNKGIRKSDQDRITTVGEYNDLMRIYNLSKSIEKLLDADYAYFVDGYEDSRGCRIEMLFAIKYDIPVLLEYCRPQILKTIDSVVKSDTRKKHTF